MSFSKTPTKGMRDFLPSEYELRQEILATIEKTYKSYGFCRIETPSVESLELLTSKNGGDNEKLIFKILKRGEKLQNAEGDICDLGLRYDLTIPLARYYSNNIGKLPSVFKAMQMDYVWRADRPQKGRFRQFMQCDIDVIGEQSNLAEIELILATCDALDKLKLDNVTIRLSDRKLLNALVKFVGFEPVNYDKVFIALDKMDKIGVVGVMEEIDKIELGKSEQFISLIGRISDSDNPLLACVDELGDCLDEDIANNLHDIITVCNSTLKNGKVVFDVTLVRGMDYYTGTIFEIQLDGLSMSVGGGGRYDKLIGKITGNDVFACGFSIGFERIAMMLNQNFAIKKKEKIAIVIDKDISALELESVMKSCNHLRKSCIVTLVKRAKNFKFQLEQLVGEGCNTIYQYKEGGLVEIKI